LLEPLFFFVAIARLRSAALGGELDLAYAGAERRVRRCLEQQAQLAKLQHARLAQVALPSGHGRNIDLQMPREVALRPVAPGSMVAQPLAEGPHGQRSGDIGNFSHSRQAH